METTPVQAKWGRKYPVSLWPALALLLLIVGLAWWSGQRGSLQDQIIGKWQLSNGQTVQFFPTGEIVGTSSNGRVGKGTYMWTSKTEVTAISTEPVRGIKQVFQVEINGDTMKNIGTDGEVEIWQRVE